MMRRAIQTVASMIFTQLSLLLRLQGRDTEALDMATKASQVLATAGAKGETTIRLAIKFREETLGPEHPGIARMKLGLRSEARGAEARGAAIRGQAEALRNRALPHDGGPVSEFPDAVRGTRR
jgi:hypothetical protein